MMEGLTAPFKVGHSQNRKAWKRKQWRPKRRVHPSVDHGGTGCWPKDGGEEDGRNERTTLMSIYRFGDVLQSDHVLIIFRTARSLS